MRRIAFSLSLPIFLLLANTPSCDKLCRVVDCPPGTHCESGKCVPDVPTPPTPTPPLPPLTCANIDCLPGYLCRETPSGPECYLPPVVECTVPDSNDPNWTTQEPKPASQKREITEQATINIGDRCGKNPDESLELLAAELIRLKECASKWADSVLIKRTDNTWEQRHAVRFSDGCWLTTDGPNIYEGVWIYGDVTIPPSNPQCSDPTPLLVFEDGSPHYRIDTKDYGSDWADVTVTYLDRWNEESRNCPYCTAIGMGTIGGKDRCTCPTRPPGHPQEVSCNDYLTGGKLALQSQHGYNCIRVDDTKFVKSGGNCRLCSVDSRVCGEWK